MYFKILNINNNIILFISTWHHKLQVNELVFKSVVWKKGDESFQKAIWVWVRIEPRSPRTGVVCATNAPLLILIIFARLYLHKFVPQIYFYKYKIVNDWNYFE